MNRPGLRWLAVVPAAFLAWFYAYPIVRIWWVGFVTGDDGLLDAIGTAGVSDAAAFTVAQAAASTALTLLVGIPIAGIFARFEFPLKRTIRAIITIPFVLPTVVVAAAFLALLGPRGTLGVDLEGTVAAILVAHVFYNVSVVVRTVAPLWESIDPRLEAAAATLGANRWRVFREVTLPLIQPAVAAAAALVFLFTFTSFGVVLILGSLEHATLEVAIWRRAVGAFDLQGAALLSILQLIGVATLLGLYGRSQRNRRVQQNLLAARHTTRRARSGPERIAVTAGLTAVVIFTLGPLLSLAIQSFGGLDNPTLSYYSTLDQRDFAFAVPPTEAVANSVTFAAVAAVIAAIVGGIAAAVVAYERTSFATVFDTVLMLPLGTSAVTVGFGFLVALDRPIDLRTSFIIVPLAHALVAIPFVVRTTAPVMAAVRSRLREAAAVLGASPRRAFREVDLPLISKALGVGTSFAFAVSLGEFGATTFIARPERPTLPVAIERFLGRPGGESFGRAMAMSVILMLVTAASVALIDRHRDGDF